MRRYTKYLIWAAVILLIFTITTFFILPPVAKSLLTDKMSQALGRPVSIQAIELNPYFLTVKVRGFKIGEPSGTEAFISFDELYIDLDSSSLFRRALIVTEARLVAPYAHIVRHPDSSYNFSDLIAKFGEKKDDEGKKSGPFHFSLNNIMIEKGSLDFADEPAHTSHKIRDLLIAVPFVGNTASQVDVFTQPAISAKINGTPYAFHGKTKPFADSHETTLGIDITDLDIPYYMSYVPVQLHFKLRSALLSTKLSVSYTQHRDKKPSLSISGDVALRTLAVDDGKGRPLIRLPLISVSLADVQPLISSFHFSKIALASPEVSIHRGSRGEMNLLDLLPATGKKTPSKEAERHLKEVPKDASPPPLIRIDEFQIGQGKIAFKDLQPATPVSLTVNRLNLQLKGFVTAKNSKAALDLSAGLDKRGTISASGPLGLDPLSADIKLRVKDIDLRPFQAYFTDKVKINVTGGAVSADGNASLSDLGKGKGLTGKYTGNLLVAN
ncbi:MAG: DUF748 domain-containing protein, partial [Syntrophales bacterium]|nr:DUF748 domain-containing protein [Syntrophales bacterium]